MAKIYIRFEIDDSDIPSIEIIRKHLASGPYNTISYDEIMKACIVRVIDEISKDDCHCYWCTWAGD